MFNDRGAQFSNGPEDAVEIRPAVFQIQTKMDGPDVLTADAARDKVHEVFKIAAELLKIEVFMHCALRVVAAVTARNEDSKAFVAGHLMRDPQQAFAAELGPDYFGGGVSFRRIRPNGTGDDTLAIEPYIGDPTLVLIEYRLQRGAQRVDLSQMSSWIGDAFGFVAGPTMSLLSM